MGYSKKSSRIQDPFVFPESKKVSRAKNVPPLIIEYTS